MRSALVLLLERARHPAAVRDAHPETTLWHPTLAGTLEFLTVPAGFQACPRRWSPCTPPEPRRAGRRGPEERLARPGPARLGSGARAVPEPPGGGRACAPAARSGMRCPAGLWRGNGGAGGRLCRDARGLSRSAWSLGSRLLEPLLGPSPGRSGDQRDPQFERQEAPGLSAGQRRQPRSQRHHPGWWGTGREGGEAAGKGSGGSRELRASWLPYQPLARNWVWGDRFAVCSLNWSWFRLRPSSPRLSRQDGEGLAGFFLCPSDEISPIVGVFSLYHLCCKMFPLWGTVLKSVVRFFSVLLLAAVILASLVLALIHLCVNVCIYTFVCTLTISHLVLLTRETNFPRRAVRCVYAKETIFYKFYKLFCFYYCNSKQP